MTEREEIYARIADAMIQQKAQYNRDSQFLVPAAVRDTARALERLRHLYRFGSIRSGVPSTSYRYRLNADGTQWDQQSNTN